MTPDDLLQKYTELRELREGVGVLSKAEATPRMRALAARFPGALRELDRLPTPLLEARLVALQGGLSERWMHLQCAFHTTLSEILRRRRQQDRSLARDPRRENSYEVALRKTAAALDASVDAVRAALLGEAG